MLNPANFDLLSDTVARARIRCAAGVDERVGWILLMVLLDAALHLVYKLSQIGAGTPTGLRELLRDSCRFSLVDLTPIAGEAQASNLQACGGCDMRLARRIGAELAITGTVQKVSNLILNMNIYVRDASTGGGGPHESAFCCGARPDLLYLPPVISASG
jgi:Protein of unknown function (DUF2380)